MKLFINTILAVAAFCAVTGSLKAGSAYDDSAFGNNPLQSPPTVPIRIEGGDYNGYR